MKNKQIITAGLAGLLAFSSSAFAENTTFENFTNAIDFVKSENIMTEKNGNFFPERTVNRAELLKVLYSTKSEYIDLNALAYFIDVPNNAWYTPYIAKAEQEGAVSGYNNGTFLPGKEVNRAEFAKIFTNIMLKNSSQYLNLLNTDRKIKDVTNTDWFAKYSQNIITLLPSDNTSNFYASKPLTRKDLAFVIYNLKNSQNAISEKIHNNQISDNQYNADITNTTQSINSLEQSSESSQVENSEKLTRKIIKFKDNAPIFFNISKFLSNMNIEVLSDAPIVGGAVVNISQEELNSLLLNENIEYIEDDILFHTDFGMGIHIVIPTSVPNPTFTPEPTPVANREPLPWGVDHINVENLWNTTQGENIRVAVIDTGADTEHSDLLVSGGINTIDNSSFDDDNGHGTHVSGTIAATENGEGVIGVAPKVKLFAVKALNKDGTGYVSDIIEGIDWAIDNNIDVINLSIGATEYSQTFHDAIKRASDAGIIIVAAAGNDGKSVNYPAKFSEVIAVSAIDSDDKVPSWSSRGDEIEFASPGVNITSTWYDGDFKTISGTSMASPHVAGIVALILSQNNNATLNDVRNTLQSYAIDIAESGKDETTGYGLIQGE